MERLVNFKHEMEFCIFTAALNSSLTLASGKENIFQIIPKLNLKIYIKGNLLSKIFAIYFCLD